MGIQKTEHVLNLPANAIVYDKKQKTVSLLGREFTTIKSGTVHSFFLGIKQSFLNSKFRKESLDTSNKSTEWTKITIGEDKTFYWVKTNDLACKFFGKKESLLQTPKERAEIFTKTKGLAAINDLQTKNQIKETNLSFNCTKNPILLKCGEKTIFEMDSNQANIKEIEDTLGILVNLKKLGFKFEFNGSSLTYKNSYSEGVIGKSDNLKELKEKLNACLDKSIIFSQINILQKETKKTNLSFNFKENQIILRCGKEKILEFDSEQTNLEEIKEVITVLENLKASGFEFEVKDSNLIYKNRYIEGTIDKNTDLSELKNNLISCLNKSKVFSDIDDLQNKAKIKGNNLSFDFIKNQIILKCGKETILEFDSEQIDPEKIKEVINVLKEFKSLGFAFQFDNSKLICENQYIRETIDLSSNLEQLKNNLITCSEKLKDQQPYMDLAVKKAATLEYQLLHMSPIGNQVAGVIAKKANKDVIELEIELKNKKQILFSFPTSLTDERQTSIVEKRVQGLVGAVLLYTETYNTPKEKLNALVAFIKLGKSLYQNKDGEDPEKISEFEQVFSLFIDKNFPDINQSIPLGNSNTNKTNLLCMVSKGQTPFAVIDVLIEKGIDLGFQESDTKRWNNTALTWAIANANNSVALHLIEKCSVEVLDKVCGEGAEKKTALQLIVMKGYREVDGEGHGLKVSNLKLAELIIGKGVDVNHEDSTGKTALYWAIAKRDIEMVKLLVNAGAKIKTDELEKALKLPLSYCKELLNAYVGDGLYYLDDTQFDANNLQNNNDLINQLLTEKQAINEDLK